jgi:protein-S-isoprenylcysteine O-methyltransferase Ste14
VSTAELANVPGALPLEPATEPLAPFSPEPTGALPRPASRIDARLLDGFERAFVLVLYAWLVVRLITGYLNQGGWGNLLLLPSEGIVVVFLLLRRRTEAISRVPSEWGIALVATCAPLMVEPGVGRALVSPLLAAIVLLIGMFVQIHAKITLGRSFGCVPANRGLKLEGPYRFVRHPMYAGYMLTHVAYLAMNPTAWNLAVYTVCYGSQVCRLLAEERFLSDDPNYKAYAQSVRFRLIPGVF